MQNLPVGTNTNLVVNVIYGGLYSINTSGGIQYYSGTINNTLQVFPYLAMASLIGNDTQFITGVDNTSSVQLSVNNGILTATTLSSGNAILTIGTVLGGGSYDGITPETVDIITNGVTYGLIQQASAHTLLGNPTGVTADVSEITLGSGISFVGTTLTATGTSISLTTTGTSGAATLGGGVLNIPIYQAAGTYVTSVSGTAGNITSSGGTAPIINIGTNVVTLTGSQALSNKTGNISQWMNDSGYLITAVTSALAGTGISVSSATGAVTFTNTLPDQTVVLTPGTGIGITGTYPNFTISNSSPSSGGTVTNFVFTNGAGFTGTVATSTTTPTLSLVLQNATTSQNGQLTSTDWNTFNNKQSTLTFGNLTDTGTDGIVVTGGTGAVIGSGTSVAQHAADSTHNGYLSSTDWTTFNSKSVVVPAALTEVNDTNVTLTLGGTPTTALLQATSLTLGWTGTLSSTRGGTGLNTSSSTGVVQVNAGTWSVSTALANGTTATTQTINDNSTKVADTAYVDQSWHDGHITLLPWNYSSISQGTWGWITNASQIFAGVWYNGASNATGDAINYLFTTSAGTYSFRLLGLSNSVLAKISVLIDGTLIATYDESLGIGVNAVFTTTGIVLGSGEHTLKLLCNSKGTTSTTFTVEISSMAFWRTA